MKKISGVVISDIHFGAFAPDKLFEELNNAFIEFLRSLETLDVIFISGDYFDHQLSVNEDSFIYSSRFIKLIVDECKRLKASLRIIYGTESHECNQYQYISHWCDDIDYKLIKFASEEKLQCGINVLYIPEEYIYSKSEYYKEFINEDKSYDYVIGHGTINELMPSARFVKKTSSSNRIKVPVFNTNELSNICKGDVFFGHYHINSTMNKNVHYCGSFSRWIFGEDEPKGFYYFTKEGKKYSHEFIENTFCDKFTTISFGYRDKIFTDKDELNKTLDKFENKMKDDIISGKVKLVFNIPEDYKEAESTILFLNERFKNNKKIKIDIVNGFVDKKHSINKEYLNESIKKYGMIFDATTPIENKTSEFIKAKYNEDISPERIKYHLGLNKD